MASQTINEVARKGGIARARKLSKARRHKIALDAGNAHKAKLERLARKRDEETK
jgi:hypothetical protein